jgi:DNA-binding NarL/FixJ family response regulator
MIDSDLAHVAVMSVVSADNPAQLQAQLERMLLDCLVTLADLASSSGQPDRELRLRDAVRQLRTTHSPNDAISLRHVDLQEQLVCHAANPGGLRHTQDCPLTPREREVAALVPSGLSNWQIGRRLVIAESTTERHIANILRKLNLASRVELAVWFIEHRFGRTR